jgi:hypothetical protein
LSERRCHYPALRNRLWGDLDSYVIAVEKSAEAIVVRGYELSKKAEDSQTGQGMNVKR